MRRVLAKLEEIANSLESKGAIREAQKVDAISNSVEAGMKNKLDAFLNKNLAKFGIKKLPTPIEAAKALAKVPVKTMENLADAVLAIMNNPTGPYGVMAISSEEESEAAETATRTQDEGGIPSELSKILDQSAERLLPAVLCIAKEIYDNETNISDISVEKLTGKVQETVANILSELGMYSSS